MHPSSTIAHQRISAIRPRNITFAFLIGALVLALLIVCRLLWPFAEPIGFALILAVSLYPLHRAVLLRLRNETGAAFVSTFLVLLLLILPILALAYFLSAEMVQAGSHLSQATSPERARMVVDKLMAPFGSPGTLLGSRLNHAIQDLPRLASDYLVAAGTLLIAGFAGFAGQAFITFLVLFFFFRDGERMTHVIAFLLPLTERHSQRLFAEVRRSILTNLYGMAVVALVQGALAFIGYLVFRIPSALLLAFLTALASVIPVLGTAIVWVPLALY
ncbi:MAG: AI-2E family transporter, partial [Acidobacteriales bacterium]|nr:AI-2E family transporter [Terriglobales bacterium]